MINKKYIDKVISTKAFQLVYKDISIFKDYEYKDPYQFFNFFWNEYEIFKKKYEGLYKKQINNTYNGQIYELIFIMLMEREGIKIFKQDEYVDDVKFVKPDILIKNKKSLIFISLKVSGRERWKQADWESLRFKQIYPNSKNYLVINNGEEAKNIKLKLPFLSIDDCFFSNSEELNNLFKIIC
tara:strand:- start:43 stop:591 length:549 start_codon:yes stop_codon:yes gene_type:complete